MRTDPAGSPRRAVRQSATPAVQRRGEPPPAQPERQPQVAEGEATRYEVPASLADARARHLQLVADVDRITVQLRDRNRCHDPNDPSTRMSYREWTEWSERAKRARNAKNAEIRWLKAWMRDEAQQAQERARAHRAVGSVSAIAAAQAAVTDAGGIQHPRRTKAFRDRLRVLAVQKVVGSLNNFALGEGGSIPRLGTWERLDYDDAVAAVADVLESLGAYLPASRRASSEDLAVELLLLRIPSTDLAFDDDDRYHDVCPGCGGDAHGDESACPAAGEE